VEGKVERLDEVLSRVGEHKKRLVSLTVIQDRVKIAVANRARFVEACEQAYHFGKGKLAIYLLGEQASEKVNGAVGTPRPTAVSSNISRFSNRLHCAECDIEYREPTPALFSFNHPVGACPTCRGFGRVISIDYNLAIPDRAKTLAEGVVKPWLTGHGLESQTDLMRACRHFEIPTKVPFYKLPKKWQDFVIDGDPDYGKDEEHHWPRAWYGVKGYFRWLESKAYKMHVRVLLSRYRAYTPCKDCGGKRFQPEALLYKVQSPTSSVKSITEVRKSKVQSREEGRMGSVEGESKTEGLTLADFYQLPIRDACRFIEEIAQEYKAKKNDPLWMVLNEVRARLGYLNDVGLGYLTLDRPTRSLSGGETERVNLTTCLGTRLVNTLFVLDEPSVGLHARDTERLVRILEALRDAGNTVVVVEHEASVMRAANQIVDLGPGHGATGGEVVFQGTYAEILKAAGSLTGEYLSGRKRIEVAERRSVDRLAIKRAAGTLPELAGEDARDTARSGKSRVSYRDNAEQEPWVLNDARMRMGVETHSCPRLRIENATRNNLKDLSVEIPLQRFVCVTGVSGSGKTTLIREVLLPALTAKLQMQRAQLKASERIDDDQSNGESDENAAESSCAAAVLEGSEHLDGVVLVDQSILGKTPRSNPAVYIGAFDDIREFFAQSEVAKQRGLNASAFSFNSSQGQCERCRGAGFEKIEMQFLSDVFIRCPDCDGLRYREHILEVKARNPKAETRNSKLETRSKPETENSKPKVREFSIADLLDATVEEAIEFLSEFSESRPARRAAENLRLLEEVGLGYLKLGQPINTLSGGESQRLKLVRHLAESVARTNGPSTETRYGANVVNEQDDGKRSTLFLFDEPTTGLHFDDVRVLLKVFQRLVDAGHSVLVIEHNLDVIKSADWVIDLGPDAGDEGGEIVAEGTPVQIAQCERSHTGKALRDNLRPSEKVRRANKGLNGLKELNKFNEGRR
jgi:excinuclease ABC subunit A